MHLGQTSEQCSIFQVYFPKYFDKNAKSLVSCLSDATGDLPGVDRSFSGSPKTWEGSHT